MDMIIFISHILTHALQLSRACEIYTRMRSRPLQLLRSSSCKLTFYLRQGLLPTSLTKLALSKYFLTALQSYLVAPWGYTGLARI